MIRSMHLFIYCICWYKRPSQAALSNLRVNYWNKSLFLYWENKTYKLKRPIYSGPIDSFLPNIAFDSSVRAQRKDIKSD